MSVSTKRVCTVGEEPAVCCSYYADQTTTAVLGNRYNQPVDYIDFTAVAALSRSHPRLVSHTVLLVYIRMYVSVVRSCVAVASTVEPTDIAASRSLHARYLHSLAVQQTTFNRASGLPKRTPTMGAVEPYLRQLGAGFVPKRAGRVMGEIYFKAPMQAWILYDFSSQCCCVLALV